MANTNYLSIYLSIFHIRAVLKPYNSYFCIISDFIMDDCKKIIRSILLSSKEGLSLQAMERDYNDIMFERIPLKKLGFQTTRELLAAMPDVANRNYRFGDEIYTAIADKSTVHIANMVSRQRSKKKKNQGGGGGGFRLPAASGGKSRVTSLLGNKYRSINYHHQGSHNMPRPMHYGNIYRAPLMHHPGQGFRFPQPLYNSPHMRMNKPQVFMRPPPPLMNPAPDAAVSLSVPVLKTQITNLLASHSGIRESDMLNLYKKRFNKELNLKANGFSNISELVDILVKRHVAFVSPTYCNAPNRMLYVNLEHIYKHELVVQVIAAVTFIFRLRSYFCSYVLYKYICVYVYVLLVLRFC